MGSTKCFFKSLDDMHEPIELKHGQELVFGRGPETRIKDSRCSRKQVKIVADCNKREASITQVGRNACTVNGMALAQDKTVTIRQGDRLELLVGQFVHGIEFESDEEGSECGRKRGAPSGESAAADRVRSSEDEEDPPDEGESREAQPPAKRLKTSDSSSGTWESVDGGKLLVYTHRDVEASSLIAAYDLDGTVIETKSGRVFPKSKDDWKILYPEVSAKLRQMHDENYKIIFFTNQGGLSSGRTSATDFKEKIENIVNKLNVPIQVFVATGYSNYRKPLVGMWEAAKERNRGLEIDMSKSFFCGDAAGREAGGTQKKKDFSHSDLLFAKNLNLRFEIPEHHFLKREMPTLKVTTFDPNAIPCDVPLCTPSWGQIISSKSELIVLVGCPGSGKSHFVKTHLIPAGYVHVNRDSLGSWSKCVSVMENALKAKQKVVVDNTNPDAASRKRYVSVAKNYTSFVRCFIMNTSLQHARHNNKFREITDPSHSVITDVVMHTYNSKYKEPTTEEGFTEILRINFWPTFKDPEHEKLYKMFLLEK